MSSFPQAKCSHARATRSCKGVDALDITDAAFYTLSENRFSTTTMPKRRSSHRAPLRRSRIAAVVGILAVLLQSFGAALHVRSHAHAPHGSSLAAAAHAGHRAARLHSGVHHHHQADLPCNSQRTHAAHHDRTPPEHQAPDHDRDCPVCDSLIAGARAMTIPASPDSLVLAPNDLRLEAPPQDVQASDSQRPRSSRGPPIAI